MRILITAGPTHEKIDPVRYIGNSSSGKMGYYIAKKAIELGANVSLIIGPTNLPMDLLNIKTIRVEDSEQMYNETITYDVFRLAGNYFDNRPYAISKRFFVRTSRPIIIDKAMCDKNKFRNTGGANQWKASKTCHRVPKFKTTIADM